MPLTAKKSYSAFVWPEPSDINATYSNEICLELPTIRGIFDRINEYRSYSPNWGTNNEPAVSPISCDKARKLIAILAYHCSMHIHPYLSPDGYVALDLKSGQKTWTIIISENKFSLVSDDEDDSEEYADEISVLNALLGKDLV